MKAAWMVWALGTAAAGLFLALAWYLAPLEPNVLALQLCFTPRAFGQIVHLWSPEQLARFRTHLLADFALLLIYAGFGYFLAARVAFAAGGRSRARWLLPAAATFDALENLLHLWLTAAPRLEVYWPYPLAGAAATAKWLLILAFAAWVWVVVQRAWRRAS